MRGGDIIIQHPHSVHHRLSRWLERIVGCGQGQKGERTEPITQSWRYWRWISTGDLELRHTGGQSPMAQGMLEQGGVRHRSQLGSTNS